MPTESELPRGIRQFALLNALEVESGRDFNVHVERLIDSARKLVGGESRVPTGQTVDSVPRAATGTEAKHEAWNAPGAFLACLLVAAFLLVLAHYLIVVRFDLSPFLLRVAAVAVPLAAGFIFFGGNRGGWALALFLAISISLIAVLCMLTVVSLVDGTPIIPATIVDWQEALEYLVTIALAALAGSALARFWLSRQ
jgi:hypothetical protein